MALKRKKSGVGLDMRTFRGKEGRYLVFRTPAGSFHVFKEVEAKQAARDCGVIVEANTREMWKQVWNRKRKTQKVRST
ncbi:MAG: hypothetical protein FJ115_01775 [Deltaproteobacteria bacterium]|nr:hypothetical protein [Deltaproteobacteria bacterium]